MQVRWFIKKTICRNGIEERTKYPVRSNYTKGVRAERAARKAYSRSDNAERQCARLLNNNFKARADAHLVLEYTDEMLMALGEKAKDIPTERGEDALFIAAQKELANFIRRVKRACQKEDVEILLLGITSDMDGKTGKPVRLHHHVVVSGAGAEACRKKWRGFALEQELYSVHGDFSPLAEYLIRQVRAVEGTKRYTHTRNLEEPFSEPPRLVTRYGDSEMRVPKGCIELYRSCYTRGATQYIRYLRL